MCSSKSTQQLSSLASLAFQTFLSVFHIMSSIDSLVMSHDSKSHHLPPPWTSTSQNDRRAAKVKVNIRRLPHFSILQHDAPTLEYSGPPLNWAILRCIFRLG